jgi:hypothetical protein
MAYLFNVAPKIAFALSCAVISDVRICREDGHERFRRNDGNHLRDLTAK